MNKQAKTDDQRIVVTGMGVITSNANTIQEYLLALQNGKSGITRWSTMDHRIYSKIGGDLRQFSLKNYLEHYASHYPDELKKRAYSLLKSTPLSGTVTALACIEAYLNAGLNDSQVNLERFGHIIGGHNFNSSYIYRNTLELQDEPEFIDALFGLYALDNDVLSVSSDILSLQGVSFMVGGACASGNLAIITALDQLRANRAERILVSGGLADLDPVCLQGWAIMDSLSFKSFNDEPERASRPFDLLREGFVPGQGAGAVILETLAAAKRRGAPILAEILGGASASDGSRLTKPSFFGQTRTIGLALHDARVAKEEINYINAHATSTLIGDDIEVKSIKSVFGDHAYNIPVNSTKSMIGHCLLSAGSVELIATVLQINHGFLHPTINYENPDPELDLDFVPNQARDFSIQIALSNSFGFGGLNSTVVVGAFNE